MQLPPRGYAMATAEQCDIASDFAVPRFPADSLNNCSFFISTRDSWSFIWKCMYTRRKQNHAKRYAANGGHVAATS